MTAKKGKKKQSSPPSEERATDDIALVDELGIEDIYEPLVATRGRLLSAAGRNSPIAEFTDEYVVMRPPQKPFQENGPSEDIVINIDEQGVLLDALGEKKKIPGARYKGKELYWLGEKKQDTLKHYAGWFDGQGNAHKLYLQGEALTTDVVFRLRNKTHDGEISIVPELRSDENPA